MNNNRSKANPSSPVRTEKLAVFPPRSSSMTQKMKNFFDQSANKVSRNERSSEELEGVVFHLTKLPGAHSRASMIDLFHTVTEWAEKNPHTGSRPSLLSPVSLLDDSEVCYPDSPSSFDSFRNIFSDTGENHNPADENPLDNPGNKSVPTAMLDFDETDKQQARHAALIDLCENCDDNSSSDRNAQAIHPDLVSLNLLCLEPTNPPKAKLTHEKSAPSTALPTNMDTRRQLGTGLKPIIPPRATSNPRDMNATLPESLRIARIEANAVQVTRRPTPVDPKTVWKTANPWKPEPKATVDLLRTLTRHRPVGTPLSQEEMADLQQPRAPPQILPYRRYQPFRAENGQKPTPPRPQPKPASQSAGAVRSDVPSCLRIGEGQKESTMTTAKQTPTTTTQERNQTHSDDSFLKRAMSRATARRLLQAESGSDFENAFRDAKKASLDPAFKLETSQRTNTVRSRVQFFESKTRPTPVMTTCPPPPPPPPPQQQNSGPSRSVPDNNTQLDSNNEPTQETQDQQFAWPRFSDRDFADPAQEHSAKWRAMKRARRKGMIIEGGKSLFADVS